MLSIERIHELIEYSKGQPLDFKGQCHDCKKDVHVSIDPQPEGIAIAGGALYEPTDRQFKVKCKPCFEINPTLTNYQSCEVYSRVVGYLRPVNQWNEGKRAEFEHRTDFVEPAENNQP